MDRLLDQCQSGPVFLREPEIAKLVASALHDGDQRFGRYELHSFVVMPNHVHLLVTPKVSAREWLGPLKGFTAHEANKILARHAPFWQSESYDHLVRNRDEFHRIKHYIANNPVRAGLAAKAEEFPWSSASGVGLLSPQPSFGSAQPILQDLRPGTSPAAGLKA